MAKIDRRLLWVDDDIRDRFLYEIDVLEEGGWGVIWAKDGESAIDRLSREAFHAVLLDQSFKLCESDPAEDVWAGCRILYWLRGRDQPREAPFDTAWQEATEARVPHDANTNVLTIVVSAFYDEEVDAAFRLLQPMPEFIVKPINELLLLKKLAISME